MHLLKALAVVAVAVPFVSAHDGPATLKIVGVNIRDLKARSILASMADKSKLTAARHQEARGNLDSRQNTDGQCGPGFGSCAAGSCCSQDGWCGQGASFCYSPGCQYNYGPACPENAQPAGTNLSSVPRTKFGSVLYGGEGIYECVRNGDIAITFDDGPLQDYTNHILDIFRSYNAKATFFVTGNNYNKGQIDLTPAHTATIQRAYAEGHQIASHTWTHLDLSAIRSLDRKNQMWKNEMALRNILGFFPTYMRPPYDSCTAASGCQKDMADLGYHITYYNVDTDDENQDSRTQIQNSKTWFRGNVTAGGATATNGKWLTLAHDVHQQTAYNLTDYMLSTLTSLGYRAVTVGECLNDPQANWYRVGAGTPVSLSSSQAASSSVSSTAASSSVSSTAASSSVSSTAASSSVSSTAISSSISSTDASSSVSSTVVSPSVSFTTVSSSILSTAVSSTISSAVVSSLISSSAISSSISSAADSTSTIVLSTTPRTSTAPSAVPTKKVTTDATCGGANGFTCQDSTFGNCCSVHGWCGSTTAYCGTGCQPAFGTCAGASQSSSSPVSSSTRAAFSSTRTSSSTTPASTKKVTTDATCGGRNGYTCQGSTFGNCCSVNGWCGSSAAYCGTGCQPAFGICTSTGRSSSSPLRSTRTSSSAAPGSTKKVTIDATCGGRNGYTCQGSTFGNCCSVNGWCGSTAAYCRAGCQRNFGTCT